MTGEQKTRPAGKMDGQQLEAALDTLTSLERRIIKLRFGLCGERVHTLKEIAGMLKVSRECVCMIEAKAIRKLRQPVRARALEGLMEKGESYDQEEKVH